MAGDGSVVETVAGHVAVSEEAVGDGGGDGDGQTLTPLFSSPLLRGKRKMVSDLQNQLRGWVVT